MFQGVDAELMLGKRERGLRRVLLNANLRKGVRSRWREKGGEIAAMLADVLDIPVHLFAANLLISP